MVYEACSDFSLLVVRGLRYSQYYLLLESATVRAVLGLRILNTLYTVRVGSL